MEYWNDGSKVRKIIIPTFHYSMARGGLSIAHGVWKN
jgi:hypothetical protein